MMQFYEMGISKPQVMLVETTHIQRNANPSAIFPICLSTVQISDSHESTLHLFYVQ